VLAVLVAVLLQDVVWGLLVHYFKTRHVWYGFFDVSDISVYESYANRFAAGAHAYSDVRFEYPPLAALLILLPKWLPRSVGYWSGFAGAMIVLCVAAAAITTAAVAWLSRSLARPIATAAAFALVTLASGPIVANRYDIAVALDLAAFAYCMARRWWWPAAAVLGIGFALKLTPAMFLPLVLIVAGRPRQMLASGLAFLLAASLPFVPHLLRSARAVSYVFTYHAERPLQIESLFATPYLLGHALGIQQVVIGNSHGSQSIVAPRAETLARLSTWVMSACLAAVYVLIWRRRRYLRASPSDLALAVLGLMVTFLCTNKVFSPQYLIWTFPFVAMLIAAPRASRRLFGMLLLVAVVLTHIGFPSRYWDLVALHATPIYLVVAQDMTLLASALFAVVLLWKGPGPVLRRRWRWR
jgi:hypothetical protein